MKIIPLKTRKGTLHNLLIILVLTCTQFLFSQQIGDPGWVFDNAKADSKYPIMKTFVNAGVQGGIPYRSSLQIKKTIAAGGNIQSGIDDVSKQGGGVLLLRNGKYTVSKGVNLKSNVVVRGESKAGVVIEVTMRGSGTRSKKDAFTFGGISRAGIEDLTMKFIAPGAEPQDDLNNSTRSWCKKCWQNNPGGKGDLYVRFVKMTSSSKNCWLDNCNFLESGTDPIYLDGQYLTCRNNLVDRAYNKGDGGNGYYDVRCDNSLIVNETVKRIRHFSIQQGAKNNVVINCKFDVDVNYHSGDRGDNLVENCDITVLRWRGWNPFATGGSQWGHKKPGPNNIIYNNKTNNRGKIGEYGGNKTVYTYKGYGSPSVLTNTPPKGGTFYPVKRGNGTTPPPPPAPPTSVAVTGVSLSGGSGILQVGEKTTFTANVLPNNASNKSVTWSSNNNNVASVNANGVITAKANGSATITVKTVDGNKTASSNITVKETTIPTPPTPPTGGCNLPKTLNDVVINKQTVNTSFGTSISCAASVTISMTIEGIGPMENADYLNIYYKVDGGAPIAISENRDAFSSKTISASGIKGNLVEIVVDGFTSFRDETYTVSNILISADSGTTTPTPDTGGQNDASITFTKPSNNQTFNTGDDVVVNVTTANNKNVAKIEMYLNGAFVRQELYDSYDWGHTSSLDPVLKNMKAGAYTLKAVVTDKAGKITENAIKIVVGAGKKNSTIAEDAFLMIAPNPVTGATLNIIQKGTEYLQIVNMLGVVVKKIAVTNEKIAVDVSQLATGVYVLRSVNKDFSGTSARFILE